MDQFRVGGASRPLHLPPFCIYFNNLWFNEKATGPAFVLLRETMMDILVVCTGNICRSPMAEGLLRHMLPATMWPGLRVHSAGTHGLDGEPAAPFAVQTAAAMGIDITGHRACSLNPEMVRQADLILVMEPFHREIINRVLPPADADRVRLLADFENPRQSDTIDDPYNRSRKVYAACLRRIQRCLAGVVRHLSTTRRIDPRGSS